MRSGNLNRGKQPVKTQHQLTSETMGPEKLECAIAWLSGSSPGLLINKAEHITHGKLR
ncbi:MAG: hypothetical protein BWY82_02965 [Verrucomicrobia bacterium ADurb.Bin474]|nr:MAG: hypothetical protein BWY82_02965 [Verrucomicrobia bacterium ADurb.Bin474]